MFLKQRRIYVIKPYFGDFRFIFFPDFMCLNEGVDKIMCFRQSSFYLHFLLMRFIWKLMCKSILLYNKRNVKIIKATTKKLFYCSKLCHESTKFRLLL